MSIMDSEPVKAIVDEAIDSDKSDTIFGKRWWSQVIEVTDEEMAALRDGKFLAIDVNGEYIVYLRTKQ